VKRLVLSAAALVAVSACGPSHISTYTPKRRQYELLGNK